MSIEVESRPLFEEEHILFRDSFRRFCEEEVKPRSEEWIEAQLKSKILDNIVQGSFRG